MTPTRNHRLLAGVALATLTLAALPAAAQTNATRPAPTPSAQTPQPTAPAATSSGGDSTAASVAEVVVTAQKRTERLLDVPASVSVLDPGALADQGLNRIQDYAERVPGLSLTSARTGLTQITLRGITTGPAQSASSTSFYLDEAPVGSVNAYAGGSQVTPDLDPSDLSRIEVLKGPQGTLYGAGAVGGLVKFVTTAPNYTQASGRISVAGEGVDGGDGGYSVRGAFSAPLVEDKLAIRASAFSRQDPGYIDNVVNGKKDINDVKVQGGRVALDAKLDPRTTVELSAFIQDTRSDGQNTADVNYPTRRPLFRDLTASRYAPEPGEQKLELVNATVKTGVGAFDITSSSTYQIFKNKVFVDGTAGYGALLGAVLRTPNLGITFDQSEKTERFSQELRADSHLFDGKLDYQLGFYFTHENDSNKIPSFTPFSTVTGAMLTLPNIISASIVSKYTEYSVFVNATYHFTDQLKLLAGVRVSHDEQHYDQDYSGLLVGPRRVNLGQESADEATFLVSPQYQITRDQLLYLRISSGYRPGGPNATPPATVAAAPNTFAPDTLTSYEVGYKASLLDRKLTVEAAGFYTEWDDIQIQTSAGGFNFFVNGGSATSRGGEITARYTPFHRFTLGLNGAYTDAHLTTDAPAAGGKDGDRLPFVPHVSGSVTADYSHDLAADFVGVLNGSVNYVGDRRSDYSGRGGIDVPDFVTVDLRAAVEHGPWELSIYGKNLNNSRGLLALASRGLTPTANPFAAAYIQPLTVGAELSLRF